MKKKIYLNETEWRYLIHSLNTLKTKLHAENQHTDTVDDTLLAVMNTHIKRVRVA